MKRPIGLGPMFALAAASVLALAGCSDDEEIRCCPGVPAGRIEGSIHIGDAHARMRVRARRIPENGQNEALIESFADTSGHYGMDVPTGRYVVKLGIENSYEVYSYSRSGVAYGNAKPDTIVVEENSRQRCDFTLASIRMYVTLSRRLDGEDAIVQLHRSGSAGWDPYGSSIVRGSAQIENGAAGILVAGIVPGRYKVEVVLGRRFYLCNCPYDGEHVWYPATRDSAQSPWIDVPSDRAVNLETHVWTEPARIEGDVTGAWMEMGLHPPEVALIDPDSNVVLGARRIGDDGRFGIDVHLPGPVKVLVTSGGLARWIGGRTFDQADVFELALGDTVSGIHLVQSGVVLDVNGTYTGFGSLVRVYDASDTSRALGTWDSMWNESYGSLWGIANLAPGRYLLEIEPQGLGYSSWIAQWFDRAVDAAHATPVTIAGEGGIVRLPVVLETGARFLGQVLGDGSSGSRIYVTPAGSARTWGLRVASQSGAYEVEGLPDGDWKIGAWPRDEGFPDQPPEGTVWYPGTTDWNDAGVIQVRNHADVTGIDIDLRGR